MYIKNLKLKFVFLFSIHPLFLLFPVTGGPPGGSTMARCAAACDFLLERCVALGAHDNLSAVVIMCGGVTGELQEKSVVSTETVLGIGMDTDIRTIIPDGMQSPEPSSSLFLGSPTSGAKDRTPTDRTLSRVFSTTSPSDQSCDGEEGSLDRNISVNRHLEFSRESQ